MSGLYAALTLIGVVLALVAGLYGAGWALRRARTPLRAHAFNSGTAPTEHAVSRFHVRWYAVSLIFLAFDMEMVFMYPWALVVRSVGVSSIVEMFSFLALLMAGVVYAWREGALRWT